MKFTAAVLLGLAASSTASTWFGKAAYNKWHETELERWLSDNNIPYPTPADRKDLEAKVKDNWQSAVESPYLNWDVTQLQKQVEATGAEVKKGAEKNKDSLVAQVKSSWTDTVDSANTAYGSVKDWIFDSWSDSALKAYADKHGIPVPQPRTRDAYIKSARESYQTVADKAGETANYPGNWLYQTWSNSDLKSWLDYHGIPAPQPGNRDKLVASVRRNSRIASLNAQKHAKIAGSSISASAQSAQETLSEAIFDAWSDSKLKEFLDKNGVNVPQGSTRNEIVALARKNAAKLTGDNVSDSAASAYGAATSKAGNQAAQATDYAASQGSNIADQIKAQAYHYYTEAQIALGLQTNYASSASRAAATASMSASSAAVKASKAAHGEL